MKIIKNYKLSEQIGRSKYGQVYRAKEKGHDEREYAVKQIPKENL